MNIVSLKSNFTQMIQSQFSLGVCAAEDYLTSKKELQFQTCIVSIKHVKNTKKHRTAKFALINV